MAFNLKKVLKALLFSTSQPLSIKDIQGAFARFHDQAQLPDVVEVEGDVPAGSTAAPAESTEPAAQPSDESVTPVSSTPQEDVPASMSESPAPPAPTETDAELYQDVPSLITATQIREAMAGLAEELRTANDVYLLIEGPTGYRLVTHPRFARWIRIMRDEPPPVKLSQSALETLAIIAYRQPVTRTEIETIRGVSAEAGLNKLLERELVYITGRADLPGRPLQYGTTDKFLEFVGVKSLVELPASDVLSPRQIDEWLKNAITTKPPTDAEMGLPLEEGEGPTPNLEEVTVEHSTTATAAEPDATAVIEDVPAASDAVEPDSEQKPA
jgi:segregation and condensation protein B